MASGRFITKAIIALVFATFITVNSDKRQGVRQPFPPPLFESVMKDRTTEQQKTETKYLALHQAENARCGAELARAKEELKKLKQMQRANAILQKHALVAQAAMAEIDSIRKNLPDMSAFERSKAFWKNGLSSAGFDTSCMEGYFSLPLLAELELVRIRVNADSALRLAKACFSKLEKQKRDFRAAYDSLSAASPGKERIMIAAEAFKHSMRLNKVAYDTMRPNTALRFAGSLVCDSSNCLPSAAQFIQFGREMGLDLSGIKLRSMDHFVAALFKDGKICNYIETTELMYDSTLMALENWAQATINDSLRTGPIDKAFYTGSRLGRRCFEKWKDGLAPSSHSALSGLEDGQRIRVTDEHGGKWIVWKGSHSILVHKTNDAQRDRLSRLLRNGVYDADVWEKENPAPDRETCIRPVNLANLESLIFIERLRRAEAKIGEIYERLSNEDIATNP